MFCLVISIWESASSADPPQARLQLSGVTAFCRIRASNVAGRHSALRFDQARGTPLVTEAAGFNRYATKRKGGKPSDY